MDRTPQEEDGLLAAKYRQKAPLSIWDRSTSGGRNQLVLSRLVKRVQRKADLGERLWPQIEYGREVPGIGLTCPPPQLANGRDTFFCKYVPCPRRQLKTPEAGRFLHVSTPYTFRHA